MCFARCTLFLLLWWLPVVAAFSAGAAAGTAGSYSWKSVSVLAGGKWVKVKTTGKGIYKIPYDKLRSWGFTEPARVTVYGNGGYKLTESLSEAPSDDLLRNRSCRGKDGSGKDCLFFYSTGTVAWRWDKGSSRYVHTVNP